MGYREALEAAGATVLAYEEFGSYQGDWLAKVSFQGDTFWVCDCFGSCSGCDAFENEIGDLMDDEGNYIWDYDHPKKKTAIAKFGARYLEPQERKTEQEVMNMAQENASWDSDADDMIAFIKAHSDEDTGA